MASENWPIEVEREFSSEADDAPSRASGRPVMKSLTILDRSNPPRVPRLTALPRRVSFDRENDTGVFRLLTTKVMQQILIYVAPKDLLSLSQTCKRMFVLVDDDDLWQKHVFRRYKGYFHFQGSWKRTFWRGEEPSHSDSDSETESESPSLAPPFPLFERKGLQSPKREQHQYRCSVPIKEFDVKINNVERVAYEKLSVKDFLEKFDRPRKPVIITGALKNWPASTEWTIEKLLAKYGNTKFKTSEVTESGKKLKMHFAEYIHYARTHRDEDPIYLFDPRFAYRAPDLLKDYKPLEYFSEDLFQCLGDVKPFFRWFVIGPARSGSAWHIDPSRTAAWNALLTGRKRWLLYPPGCTPPGVRLGVAKDGGEKYISACPVKWLLKYYATAMSSETKPIEVTQEPGEIIYVPSGWWHMVLNLDLSIAVTQNFANSNNFNDVWRDLVLCNSRLVGALQKQLMPFRPDLFLRVGVPVPASVFIHPPPANFQLPPLPNENNVLSADPNYYDQK